MRDVLALIVCGDRICEVISATLGPLHLDQLPKSKPVTPYAVMNRSYSTRGQRRTPDRAKRPMSHTPPPNGADLTGRRRDDEKPPRALAVAEDALAGA